MSVGLTIAIEVFGALTYNLIFLGFCWAGLIVARKSNWAWALFSLGVAWNTLQFVAEYREIFSTGKEMETYFMIAHYIAFAIAIVFFILIMRRRKQYATANVVVASPETKQNSIVGVGFCEDEKVNASKNDYQINNPVESRNDSLSVESGIKGSIPNNIKEEPIITKGKEESITESDAPINGGRFCSRCGAPINSDTEICPRCGKKFFTKKTIKRLQLSLLICLLLIGNICQLSEGEKMQSRLSQIQAENDELNRNIRLLQTDLSNAKTQRNNYSFMSGEYTQIKQWIQNHGSDYKDNSNYYAATNIIAVQTGEIAYLDITYKGNQSLWMKTTQGNCNAEWMKRWSNNTTQVIITGVKPGIDVIVFTLGDNEKSTSQEYFEVLVIIV